MRRRKRRAILISTELFVIYSKNRKTKIRWGKEGTQWNSWNYEHTAAQSWKNCFGLPARTVSREALHGRDMPFKRAGAARDIQSPSQDYQSRPRPLRYSQSGNLGAARKQTFRE